MDESATPFLTSPTRIFQKLTVSFKSDNPCTASAENYYIIKDLYFKEYNDKTRAEIAERISRAVK
jgi:hypothetical protein